MHGKGRWSANLRAVRLWQSLNYECVHLRGIVAGSQARNSTGKWLA